MKLTQDGVMRPEPPGGAWVRYRAEPQVRDRLVGVIAARANRNYLVAAIAAHALSTDTRVLDPAAAGFNQQTIPASVGDGLTNYLESRNDRPRMCGLLTAIAYARGAGIGDRLWLAFAAALGYEASREDLDNLHDSSAADYLLQTTSSDEGQLVTRLFHQALNDEILQHRDQVSDEKAILAVLRPPQGSSWAQSGAYERVHAAEHAAACGLLAILLGDPHYLAADLARLLPLLPSKPEPDLAPMARILQSVADAQPLPPNRRARILALAAAHQGLTEQQHSFASACADGIQPLWAHRLGTPHQVLTGHTAYIAEQRERTAQMTADLGSVAGVLRLP